MRHRPGAAFSRSPNVYTLLSWDYTAADLNPAGRETTGYALVRFSKTMIILMVARRPLANCWKVGCSEILQTGSPNDQTIWRC